MWHKNISIKINTTTFNNKRKDKKVTLSILWRFLIIFSFFFLPIYML